MKARIHNPGALPEAFAQYREQAAGALEDKTAQVDAAKARAAARLEASPLAESWAKAQDARWGSDVALVTLLEQVKPWQATQLEQLTKSSRQLASLVHSFDALCERLAAASTGPQAEDVTPNKARGQYNRRTELLGLVDRVRTAVAAAGAAAGKFPTGQLDAIAKRLETDAALVMDTAKKGGHVLKPSLQLESLDGLADPAAHLAEALREPALADGLRAAEARAEDKAAFKENLAGMALLLDEAKAAPDYAKTGKGWFHPSARKDYRARTHDAFSRFSSADRQTASQAAMKAALTEVAGAKAPGAALESALVSTFLKEIGYDEGATAKWAPKPEAVKAALLGELFLPLRALRETRASMTKGDEALLPHVERAVSDIAQHIVEGDYAAWRYDNPVSKKQLEGLSEAQLGAWKADNSVAVDNGQTQLKTREEDGLGLPWVTKIGGPSHGFDYGGECLLPLLSNGRTKAILIDDPKWPHNAAARSYIRLLHTEDGSPTLYLEPFQRDFPHRKQFGDDPQLNDFFYSAIVKHAVQKADEMGLPLSIGRQYAGVCEQLGVDVKPVQDKLLLKASNGVYEASDTLSGKHDWPQMQDELTNALPRLQYRPA